MEALLSQVNEERRRAEAAFAASLAERPSQVVAELVRVVQSHEASLPLRLLCAVLLRQTIVNVVWATVDESSRQAALGAVAATLASGVDGRLRRRCADCVAAAAQASLPEARFGDEAIQWCLGSAASEAGLELLERLCAEVSPVALRRGGEVARALAVVFESAATPAIHCAAARAALAWCLEAETEDHFVVAASLARQGLYCVLGLIVRQAASSEAVDFALRAVCELVGDDDDNSRRSVLAPNSELAMALAVVVAERAGPSRGTALEAVARCVQVGWTSPDASPARLAAAAWSALVENASATPLDEWCVSGRELVAVAHELFDDDNDDEWCDDDPLSVAASFEGLGAQALHTLSRIAATDDLDLVGLGPQLRPLVAPGARSVELRRAALAALIAVASTDVPDALLGSVAEVAVADPVIAVRAAAFDCLTTLAASEDDDEDDEDPFWEGLAVPERWLPRASSFDSDDDSATVRFKVISSAASQAIDASLASLSPTEVTIERLCEARAAAMSVAAAATTKRQLKRRRRRPDVSSWGESPTTNAVPIAGALTRAIETARRALASTPTTRAAARFTMTVAVSAGACARALACLDDEDEAGSYSAAIIVGLVETCLNALLPLVPQDATNSEVTGAALALGLCTASALAALASRADAQIVAAAFERAATFAVQHQQRSPHDESLAAAVVERGCLRSLGRAVYADPQLAASACALACAAIDRRPAPNASAACKALYDVVRTTLGAIAILRQDGGLRVGGALADLARRSSSPSVVVFATATVQRLFDDAPARAGAGIDTNGVRRLVAVVAPPLVDAVRNRSRLVLVDRCGGVPFSATEALSGVAEALARALELDASSLDGAALVAALTECAAEAEDSEDLLEHLAAALNAAHLDPVVRAPCFRESVSPILSTWLAGNVALEIHVFGVAAVVAFFDLLDDTQRAVEYVLRQAAPDRPLVVRRAAVRRASDLARWLHSKPGLLAHLVQTLAPLVDDLELGNHTIASLVVVLSRHRHPASWLAPDDVRARLLPHLPLQPLDDPARAAHADFLASLAAAPEPRQQNQFGSSQVVRILVGLASEQPPPGWVVAVLNQPTVETTEHTRLLLRRHFVDNDAAQASATRAYWATQPVANHELRHLARSLLARHGG